MWLIKGRGGGYVRQKKVPGECSGGEKKTFSVEKEPKRGSRGGSESFDTKKGRVRFTT